MKKVFGSLRHSLNDAVCLFKIQLGFGWKGVFVQFLYAFMNAAKSVIPVLLPKIIIDVCTKGDLSAFVAVLLGFSVLSWVIDATIGISEWVQTIYNLRFAHFFKRRICEKAMNVDYRDIEDQKCLDSLERAMDAAYYGLSDTLFSSLAVSLMRLAFLFFTISSLNVWIAVVTLSVVVAVYGLNRKAAEKNHKFEMERSPFKRRSDYAENCVLDFGPAKDIRIFGAKDMFRRKFIDASEAEIGVKRRQNRFNLGIGVLKTLVNGLMICGMYVYLIFRYSAGLVTISSFTMYLTALSEFYGAVDGMFEILLGFRESSINLREVEETLGRKETVGVGGEGETGKVESIEFRNVTFTYPEQSDPAIKNFNLKINANESVILVGENGAGKTTLVKLLLRLYDVDSGAILVNGKDIRELPYRDYVSHFAPVFQDVWLFAYSVKENITFLEKADEERLKAALEFADIAERIFELPDGTGTFCTRNFDENGVNFSGGEQQKLCVARAIYRNADVVIMDEPNAALDALSEKALSDNIRELAKSKLVLLISHRLSMSRFCSHVVVLENGEILEEGTHDELLSKHGRYSELYEMQVEQYR